MVAVNLDLLKFLVEILGISGIIIAFLKYYLDKRTENYRRYSKFQFMKYNEIWGSLCDLRFKGKKLWKRANLDNLGHFMRSLEDAEKTIEKNRLLINDKHYKKLIEIIKEANEFRIGKRNLIETRRPTLGISLDKITKEQIENMIENNKKWRKKYEKVIEEIGKSFKKQLIKPTF